MKTQALLQGLVVLQELVQTCLVGMQMELVQEQEQEQRHAWNVLSHTIQVVAAGAVAVVAAAWRLVAASVWSYYEQELAVMGRLIRVQREMKIEMS